MLKRNENYKQVKKLMKRLNISDIKNLNWNVQTEDDCSWFEEAVYAGFNESELSLILNYALEHGMDINKRTSMYGDTYMHTLIECDDYHGNLTPFLYLGYLNNFNPNLKNDNGKTVWDALENPETTKTISESDKELCFKIKELYDFESKQVELKRKQNELKSKQDELKKIKAEIIELQQKEKELDEFLNSNKSLVNDIEKSLNLKKIRF